MTLCLVAKRMLEFTLPWPQPKLSPNSRTHWSILAREKKIYRGACWATAKDQLKGWMPELPIGPLLCDALRCDNKRFTTLTARVNAEQIGGLVRVRISKEPLP